MQAVLRPMNLGEILDRTFEIYRKRFLLFAGIAALPAAAMLALHLADIRWVHTNRWIRSAGGDEEDRVALSFLLGFGFYHISGFVGLLFQPAFVHAVSQELFGGSKSVLDSLRFAAARWRTYLWVAFLKHCAQLIAPEAIAISLFAGFFFVLDKLGMIDNFFPLGGIFFLLIAAFLMAFFWIGTSLAFAMPAAALEQTNGWKSLGRSWRLTRNSRWRILVAFLMVMVGALILEAVVGLLAWWIARLLYPGPHPAGFNPQVYRVIVHFLYTLVVLVVEPVYPIAITLLYYDQRSRKEGYDVERMMEAAGLLAPVATDAAPLVDSSAVTTGAAREFPVTEL